MTGYLINFSLYTLAMVGVIFCALFVFKGVMTGKGFSKKSDFLSVEETMSLSPRKTLYVIKAGAERFLLASDIDKTNLIAKLEESSNGLQALRQDRSSELNSTDGITSLDEFNLLDFKREKTKKEPVMRELARKLSSI